MIRRPIWLALWPWLAAAAELLGVEPITFVFESSQEIPHVEFGGHPAVVHTQGLFVTDTHFYVTGRLERTPRRALFLRFDRNDLRRYEVLDITPNATMGAPNTLDHPGGFDFDGKAFWIPVARSEPRGPTLVIRVPQDRKMAFGNWKRQIAFRVDDHIGALAWEPTRNEWYGASWDTKCVYSWSPKGDLVRKSTRDNWLKSEPSWQLAVQDWKSAGDFPSFPRSALVAGGMDRRSARDRTPPSAVVDWIDPIGQTHLARVFVPLVPGYDGPPTREGLALHGGKIYLLPGDLGRNASVLCYRIAVAAP